MPVPKPALPSSISFKFLSEERTQAINRKWKAWLHWFLNVALTPNPILRAGWAMGSLFHLNELKQNQGRPPADYSSPWLSPNLGKQPLLYLRKLERRPRAEEGCHLMPWVVWMLWGRKQAQREPGKSKIKRWSRTAAGKKVKSHSWAVLDHLWNFPNSPNPERTPQISGPLKARLHQSLWGSNPFQLVWHPRRWAHISSLVGPRSLLQPGHPLAGQAAVRTGPTHSSCALKSGPNPLALCFQPISLLPISLRPNVPLLWSSTAPFAQAHSKSCWFQHSLSTLAPHHPLLSSHSPFFLLPHLLYWPLKKTNP